MVIHYDYEFTVDEMYEMIVKWGIKNVGVDFDRTLIGTHTADWGFDPERFSKEQKHDYIIDLVKKLLDNPSINVAIVTFCHKTSEQVSSFCELVFDQKIPVYACHPREGKVKLLEEAFLSKGYDNYINEETGEYFINETLLIDDSEHNLEHAYKQGYRGLFVYWDYEMNHAHINVMPYQIELSIRSFKKKVPESPRKRRR